MAETVHLATEDSDEYSVQFAQPAPGYARLYWEDRTAEAQTQLMLPETALDALVAVWTQRHGRYVLTREELSSLLAAIADLTHEEGAWTDWHDYLTAIVARWGETMREFGLDYQAVADDDRDEPEEPGGTADEVAPKT
jgi:hypothetical protein